MSAVAAMATMLVALIPTQAGDTTTASSIVVRGDTAYATATGREAGRLAPKRLPGWPAWSCTRGRGRSISCTVATRTHVVRVSAGYSAVGGRSTTSVRTRLVAR